MAEDIVQTVKVEGADQAASEFDKVADGATKMSKTVAGSMDAPNREIEAVGRQVEGLARKFGSSLRDFGTASTRFVSNVGRMAGTVTKFAAAAGLGIAAIKKFSAATADQSEDVKQAVAQNKLQERSYADSAIRALENEKAVRDLNRAFGQGKMTAAEYGKAFAELQRAQREEEETARRVALIRSAEAEDRIRQEAAIKKEAAARKAYADAVESYGADTASALTQLGPAYDSFMRKMNEGPSVIADIMRGIALLFNKHGDEIVKIVNDIGDAFASLFDDGKGGGDRAAGFAQTMITAVRAVGSAIKDYLIPIIKTIVGAFDVVAKGLNAMFGTQLTGGILAIGAALLIVSGALPALAAGVVVLVNAFKLLNTALMALGSLTPMGLAIRAIIAALVLLYVYWDDIKKVVGTVVDYVTQKWAEFGGWFTGLWESIKTAASDAWNAVGKYATDAYTYVTDTWDGALSFFSDLWEKIKSGAAAAWDYVKSLFGFGGAPGGAGAEGKKRGGPIHGRGTSTSDSVPIWASRGEWVIRAQAAQFYGRRFMSMINSMRVPRDFSLADSLVLPSPKTHFATGGEVGGRGSRVLNLTLPGLGSFPGLTGPDDTMDRLQVAAVRSQIRSAGRLPGWYGGR